MMAFLNAPEERRRYTRTQINMPIQAVLFDPDGEVVDPMEMIDISRGGMGAVSRRAYYPGQRIVVKLPAPGMSVRNVYATVRRCGKSDGRYHVGLEFDRPMVSLCSAEQDSIVAAA